MERFHQTVLDEFYRVAFRKTIYGSIAELQADLDSWVRTYNEERPHQGRWCFGKTPMHTFLDPFPSQGRNSSPPDLIRQRSRPISGHPLSDEVQLLHIMHVAPVLVWPTS